MPPDPVLTTRLRLDVPTLDDAAGIFAILGDARTVEHNPSDRLADLVETRALVTRWIEHWGERSFGYWCVRQADDPRVIGYCGLKQMTVHAMPVLNLVYRFAPDAWGHGYATEAASAAVGWIEERRPGETVIARVRPDNTASTSVALKAGLQRDPDLDVMGEDGLDLAFTNRNRRK